MKKNREKNILVPIHMGYGRAIDSLGNITDDYEAFFERPRKFDMVLFTGGEDVDPQFYGDKSPLRVCSFYTKRDIIEINIFRVALDYGIPMAGICRGLQLFNAMAGGKLMHDIRGHAGRDHDMEVIDGDKHSTFRVNSLHHQMIIPEDDVVVTGWSSKNLSNSYIGANDERVAYNGVEVESAIFPKLKAFGVQYHPECMKRDMDGYIYFESMAIDALHETWEEFLALHSPTSKTIEKESEVIV